MLNAQHYVYLIAKLLLLFCCHFSNITVQPIVAVEGQGTKFSLANFLVTFLKCCVPNMLFHAHTHF